MSEQDFFFEEEPDTKASSSKGTPSKQGAPKGSKGSTGQSAGSGKQPSKAVPVVEAPSSIADQSTTWAVASLVGVIGLLLGAILGFMLGNSLAGVSTSTTTPQAPITSPSSGVPSTLTTEQLNSGELPAGHPAINPSGTGDASGAATPGQ